MKIRKGKHPSISTNFRMGFTIQYSPPRGTVNEKLLYLSMSWSNPAVKRFKNKIMDHQDHIQFNALLSCSKTLSAVLLT